MSARIWLRRAVAGGFAFALLLSCGYGRPVDVGGLGQNTITGRVVLGAVAQSTVTAYRLDSTMRRGDVLATSTVEGSGEFALNLPAFSGGVLLVASGGTFLDPAVGSPVSLGARELTAVLPSIRAGTTLENIAITPVSHLQAALASRLVAAERKDVSAAVGEAKEHLDRHFGDLDWLHAIPTDLTASASPQLDSNAKSGLIIAALSVQARDIAEAAGLSPGGDVSAMALVEALAEDVASDGYFDGEGNVGPLRIPGGDNDASYRLDGQTVRLALALACERFLESGRNASPITSGDTRQLRFDLSTNSDRRIFRDDGNAYDEDPPRLLVVDAGPPRYTRESTVTFAVVADDGTGTGVRAVYARNGVDAVPVAAVQDAGNWVFRDLALRNGPNRFIVWAEDNASPPNRGLGRGEPLELTVDVMLDTSVPSPALVPVASYVDERSLTVEHRGGMPLIPAAYRLPGGAPKVTLIPAGKVWKVKTRLSWGPTPPSAAELEGANPQNVPFLQFVVGWNPETEAPITEVTYSLSVSCSGCPTGAPSTGRLIPAQRSEDQRVFFDLPLSVETIPLLAELPSSPAALSISVTATDAAGNNASTVSPTEIDYSVIGPPLVAAEDTNYAAADDVRSAFPYRLSAGTYARVWSNHSDITANADGTMEDGVRVVRYLVRNPHPVPVGLRADGLWSSRWEAVERWDPEVFAHSANFTMDGHTFEWLLTASKSTICSTGLYPRHVPQTQSKYECVPLPYPTGGMGPSSRVETSSGLKVSAFGPRLPKGGERIPAPRTPDPGGSAYWVVPPAQGQVPGELVVYVLRPLRSRGYVWGDFGTVSDYAFRTLNWDYYILRDAVFTCAGGANCYELRAWRYASRLASASERAVGTVTWKTSALRSDGRALGDVLVSGSSPFDVSVQH